MLNQDLLLLTYFLHLRWCHTWVQAEVGAKTPVPTGSPHLTCEAICRCKDLSINQTRLTDSKKNTFKLFSWTCQCLLRSFRHLAKKVKKKKIKFHIVFLSFNLLLRLKANLKPKATRLSQEDAWRFILVQDTAQTPPSYFRVSGFIIFLGCPNGNWAHSKFFWQRKHWWLANSDPKLSILINVFAKQQSPVRVLIKCCVKSLHLNNSDVTH